MERICKTGLKGIPSKALSNDQRWIMPKSMTGFARIEKDFPEGRIICEVRSLNSRYLEMNIRLPRTDYAAEQKLRDLVKKNIKRGKIDITIKWEKAIEDATIPKINENIVRQYAAMARDFKEQHGIKGELTVDTIFGLKDVFVYEENHTLSEDMLTEICGSLLDALNEERAREGNYITGDLVGRMEMIETTVTEVEAGWPDVIKAHEEKLRVKINEVTQSTTIDEARILQELAIYMERLDISEEIVRLRGHLGNFRTTLSSADAIGRKLDFIIQEMVRETNTIGSKSNDLYINERVIRIKVEIEKMREQVQNVE
ncbi:MAG: YicC family protein [Deltaproteobacteria bacterium]|nr:YicC family protein [Deltaproteobacteria bacterium]